MANQRMKDAEGLLLVEPLQELYKKHDDDNLYRWKPQNYTPLKDEELQAILDKEPADAIRELLDKWHELYYYTAQEVVLHWVFHELCPRNDSYLNVLLKVSVLNDFYSTGIGDTGYVAKRIWQLKEVDEKGKPLKNGRTLDERLQDRDFNLVKQIAEKIEFPRKDVFGNEKPETIKTEKKEKYREWSFRSFASKFCSHHKLKCNEGKKGEDLKEFPILDSNVEEMLYYFQKKDHFIKDVAKEIGKGGAFDRTLTRINTLRRETILEEPEVLHAVLCHFRRYYGLTEHSLRDIDHYLWLRGKIDTYLKNKNKKKK